MNLYCYLCGAPLARRECLFDSLLCATCEHRLMGAETLSADEHQANGMISTSGGCRKKAKNRPSLENNVRSPKAIS